MMMESVSRSWQPRRSARWSMPVCLQPRAARHVRILRAEDKRPVPVSRLGYHLRPRGHYQLEFASDAPMDSPGSITLVAGPVRRSSGQDQVLAHDGRTLRRVDFQVAGDDEGRGICCHWWTRLEPLVMRLEYPDGRDDCEQASWLLIAPRRLWALWVLLSSALVYGLVPWLCRAILERGGLPEGWRHVLHLLAQPAVWQGLMLVVVGFWLAIWVSDRVLLWLRVRHLRNDLRRDVQHYLQRADPASQPRCG